MFQVIANRLTLKDRCDGCGARAYLRASNHVADLLFCGHHGQSYKASLEAQGFFVEDYSAYIRESE